MRYHPAVLQGKKKSILTYISVVALLFLLCTGQALAKTYRILIVSSGSSAIYADMIDTLQTAVANSAVLRETNTQVAFTVAFLNGTAATVPLQEKARQQDLLLTIGQGAIIAAAEISPSLPVIATLIPKQTYDHYRATFRKANIKSTAIFIDNPPERQIALARLLLGNTQKLGVLIGENSPEGEIESALRKMGSRYHIETVKRTDNLISKLSYVLSDTDVFMAFPDAQIFNRDTAKNILLTTYRRRTPVIAYSASYVKAGALAAVYSTAQQIAEQTADTLIRILASGLNFPEQGSHPKYFEIAINRNVAKSLVIPVSSETEIKDQLLQILEKTQ